MKRNIIYAVLGILLLIGSLLIFDRAWASTNLNTTVIQKSGVTTRNMTTASGTQTIAHGLGVTPNKVTVHATVVVVDDFVWSHGSWTSSGNRAVWGYSETATSHPLSGTDTTNAIYLEQYNGESQAGVISVDATNITITWTKTNTPDGTAQILWEAEGQGTTTIQEENTTTIAWSNVTSTPTTLSGYGITDGIGSLATLTDVNLTSLTDLDMLQYDATNTEWINVVAPTGGGGGCTTFICLTGTEEVFLLDETTQYGFAVGILGITMLLTSIGVIIMIKKVI